MRKRPSICIACGTALLLAGAIAFAATGGGFDLAWWSVDGSTTTISGGDFELTGSVGQFAVGEITGGDFSLASGFLSYAAESQPAQWLLY